MVVAGTAGAKAWWQAPRGEAPTVLQFRRPLQSRLYYQLAVQFLGSGNMPSIARGWETTHDPVQPLTLSLLGPRPRLPSRSQYANFSERGAPRGSARRRGRGGPDLLDQRPAG